MLILISIIVVLIAVSVYLFLQNQGLKNSAVTVVAPTSVSNQISPVASASPTLSQSSTGPR